MIKDKRKITFVIVNVKKAKSIKLSNEAKK